MDKLSDLELITAIAEIEGVRIEIIEHSLCNPWVKTEAGTRKPYNPLTDDALCFQLMVKHKVYVDYFCGNARAALKYNGSDCEFQVDVVDMSMNRAICMAIVEANNG